MNCTRCGVPIKTAPNLKFCEACRAINKKEQAKKNQLNQLRARRELTEGKRAEVVKHKPSQPMKISTDAEQFAHDQALRKKYDVPPITVIYKPGTAAFKAAAQEIMQGRTLINGHGTTKFRHFGEVPIDVRQFATR